MRAGACKQLLACNARMTVRAHTPGLLGQNMLLKLPPAMIL